MSNEVKRYDISGFGGGMVESQEGAWYHMDDYAALEAERDELQRRLDAADEWATMASEQLKERDALRTQLEAIRAAGGEQVDDVKYEKLLSELREEAGTWPKDSLFEKAEKAISLLVAEVKMLRGYESEWEHILGELRAELEAARKQEPAHWWRDGVDGVEYCQKPFTNDWHPLYALPPLAGKVSVPEWVPVSERLPEPGVTVMVYTPPQPGDYPYDVRISFDGICPESDGDYWIDHGEHYEHYCMIAKGGDDIEWHGPSEKAPYTHWMPLPAAPALLATPSMEVSSNE